MWIPLNCHSCYSLLRGTANVDALTQKAAGMGFPALALTDTNATYGAVAFQRAAQAMGIRPIFGAEVDDPETGNRAVLLAKNLQGFGEVCRVVTDRNLKADFSLASRLRHCNDQVIILSPDLDVIDKVAQARGSRNLGIELIRWERCGREDIQRWEFSHAHRIPLVASNRVFFPEPNDWATHRLLTAIRLNTSIPCLASTDTVSPEAWLKSQAEMEHLYSYVPQALENTRRVAEQCDMTLPIGQLQFPPFDLSPGQTHAGQLRQLAWDGVRKLYDPITARVRQRLQYELGIIEKMRFASYFLLVWDIVREAHRRGIPTVGRGSAANSLVCRVLAITEVDPIENNLYFERFLHEQREDFPDIDIDFPWNRRDEMIQYVFDKYGAEHVALISTHIHMGSRSALREAGKALGIPGFEISRMTDHLSHSADLSNLEAVRDTIPECRDLPLEDQPDMIACAQKIAGLPRHISIHCGGLVVSATPITDLIPLQKTPKGFEVTQYDMYPVEDLGLLKIDLLAQRGLAVEVDTVQAVQKRHGTLLDFSSIDPVTDSATRALVRNGNTMGCFYIESPGMRNLLQKLRVNSFEKLTAASSIIRPGVASSGMMQAYINRHNGRESVTYLHPKLKEVLSETYGIMIYQEDVIKVAHAIAGMSLGEAEGLRKCMSKKRDWERMETYRGQFLAGAEKNGISEHIRNEIWRQIDSFAGYSFCKAHSASFALVSYRAAYLKAHHPAEFMAAVLTNEGGFYDACAYVEEARRLAVVILPPHINHSRYESFAERPDAIRIGLMQVRGLSRAVIDRIVRIRKERLFESVQEFLQRVTPDLTEAETLIHCGALDGLGSSRPAMFVESLIWHRKHPAPKDSRQTTLALSVERRCIVPDLPELEEVDKLRAECDALGLAATAHPMALYGITTEHWPSGFTRAKDIGKVRRKLVSMLGILVTDKSTRTTKGERMKFVSLEDPTGIFEVTLFPRVYQKFGHVLTDKGPFVVKGRIEEDSGNRTVTALWLGRMKTSLLKSV